jgi:hypothetical protein
MENTYSKTGKVYIVHHVDTEGPLFENLEEIFKRLYNVFGIQIKPNTLNLNKLRNKKFDLKGLEDEVALFVDPHTTDFKSSWPEIDEMLDRIMSDSFRNKLLDHKGKGWVYNWHCMDHIGYENNPRKRDIGYLNILDFYRNKIIQTHSIQDALHWHFHPINFFKDAHICATSYNNSMFYLQQSITRRIVERNFFPVVNRAGFHSERPDSHLFLEQWIPFDPSNLSADPINEPKHQRDLSNGRFGDWRWAPSDWSIYHPHHDNYQIQGNCRRVIARVLNMKSRHRSITIDEVKKAFKNAQSGEDVYLGITNHDFREMSIEIDEFRGMLRQASLLYSNVDFFFSESVNAFQKILFKDVDLENNAIEFDLSIDQIQGVPTLVVKLTNGSFFGPQPWLALKTKSRKYYTDNFDVVIPDQEYSYTFDSQTIKLGEIDQIAVASNDKYGYQKVLRLLSGKDF